jgi:oligopeptidase B
MDEEHRPNELRMRVLGRGGGDSSSSKEEEPSDVSILKEDDALFWMGIGKTSSKRFLACELGSKETSEVHMIDLHGVSGAEAHVKAAKDIKCMSKRVKMVRYDVDHLHKDLLIVTNKDGAKTNKLCSVSVDGLWDSKHWKDVRPYDKAVQVDAVQPFDKHVAIFGREAGMTQMWVAETKGQGGLSQWKRVEWPEKVFSVVCGPNRVFDTDKIRIGYTSLTSPMRTMEYDMNKGTTTILKEKEVPNYNQEEYACMRLEAPSRDGKTRIPMSIVYVFCYTDCSSFLSFLDCDVSVSFFTYLLLPVCIL